MASLPQFQRIQDRMPQIRACLPAEEGEAFESEFHRLVERHSADEASEAAKAELAALLQRHPAAGEVLADPSRTPSSEQPPG